MEYILIIISLLIIMNLWAKVSKLEGRIKGMQYTINQLTQQSGLPEHPWLLRVWINDQGGRQNLFYPGNIDLSIFTRV